MLEAFLRLLSETLGNKTDVFGKNAKKLSKKLKAYSGALQLVGSIASPITKLISVIFVSILGITSISLFEIFQWNKDWLSFFFFAVITLITALPSITDKFRNLIDAFIDASSKSIEELREEIGKDLENVESPILVFIDDVDRLSKEEIKLLFQLIRANLRFKNLTFVLMFQRDIVAAALDDLTSGHGSAYIGKIIQVEFDVPKPSTKDMQSFLFKKLNQVIFEDEEESYFDESRWQDVFHEHLWPYFKSLRDIKRFGSSFQFYAQSHLNDEVLEVDAVDLVAIEVLRVFDNEAYLKISRILFTEKDSLFDLFGEKEEERKERFNQLFDAITSHLEEEAHRKNLKSLLIMLFPQASGVGAMNESKMEWHRRARICDKKSFPRYFELTIGDKQATLKDLDRILQNAHNRNKSVELLQSAIADETIESLLTLILYAREDIKLDSMEPFITALFNVGDKLPLKDIGSFEADCIQLCNQIIYHRLKNEDKEIVTTILLNANKCTDDGFYLPLYNLRLEDKSSRKKGNRMPNEFLIKENDLKEFYEINLRRIRTKADTMSLLEHPKFVQILHCWYEWTDTTEAKDWVTQLISEPEKAINLLIQFLGETSSKQGSKSWKEPILKAKSMEKFVDLEKLLYSIQKVPEAERQDKATEALELLELAIEKKNNGENYETVRPRNSRVY